MHRLGLLGPLCMVGALGLGACKAPKKASGPKDKAPKDNLPQLLEGYTFVESFRGTPSAIGCSDGQREGFADLSKFPNIAGCLGSWQGRKKLNADKVGPACGDDSSACIAPADLCAAGWHLCAKDGNAADIKKRVSAGACNKEAGPGRFVAAMSHGQVARICPPPPGPHTRFPCMERGICAEAVCCGDACSFGACRDAVWRGKTKISRASANGCGSAVSRFHGGVLCCRDNMVKSVDAAQVQGDLGQGIPPQPKKAPTPPSDPGSQPGAADAAAKGGAKPGGKPTPAPATNQVPVPPPPKTPALPGQASPDAAPKKAPPKEPGPPPVGAK